MLQDVDADLCPRGNDKESRYRWLLMLETRKRHIAVISKT